MKCLPCILFGILTIDHHHVKTANHCISLNINLREKYFIMLLKIKFSTGLKKNSEFRRFFIFLISDPNPLGLFHIYPLYFRIPRMALSFFGWFNVFLIRHKHVRCRILRIYYVISETIMIVSEDHHFCQFDLELWPWHH